MSDNVLYYVINEQHALLPAQETALNALAEHLELETEKVEVPAEGLNVTEILSLAQKLEEQYVVIVSPIPLLVARLGWKCGFEKGWTYVDHANHTPQTHAWIMHNDKREKKELPNGKVISTIAQTGWVLLSI